MSRHAMSGIPTGEHFIDERVWRLDSSELRAGHGEDRINVCLAYCE